MMWDDKTDAELIDAAYLMTKRTQEVVLGEGHPYLTRFFTENEPRAILEIFAELKRRRG